MSSPTLKEVIEAAGGTSALAHALRISPAAVSQWKLVPVQRVLAVEKLTGISRHKLRPDLYGTEPEVAA